MNHGPSPVPANAQRFERPHPKSEPQPADSAAARAWQRFSHSPYRELREVHCRSRDGVLVLEGEVSSFYLKQMAQEIARQIEGVEIIANWLEVNGNNY